MLCRDEQQTKPMESKKKKKKGLPQGSVLAPMLFNIYTNDQPHFQIIRRFSFADDLCIVTQSKSFKTNENVLTDALQSLSTYYEQWSLNANPGKTQVCTFHLNSHQANSNIKVTCENKIIENNKYPLYLGVTLNRTLSSKEHTRKLKETVKLK